jgi:ribosomal protein S18 acetylase RimI-like enzyme
MPKQYSLRPVTEADYAFLWLLHQRTLKEYAIQTWGRWDDAVEEPRFRSRFDPAKLQIIVQGGRDIGLVSTGEKGDEMWLGRIQILPEKQGQGIGTAVIEDVLAIAQQRQRFLTLTVLKVNPARRLYERLGFRVTGETETHYAMRVDP